MSGGKIEKHIFLLELSTGGREDKVNFSYMISNVIARYDDYHNREDSGYPKHIRNWRGVPDNIDGVITWTDGKLCTCFKEGNFYLILIEIGLTYFFKDGRYWRFNDYMVITERELPRESSRTWLGC